MERSLETIMEEFMKIPGWEQYPLPEIVYTKFNLKKPTAVSIVDYFNNYDPNTFFAPGGAFEVRPPAEGGVRIVPEAPPLEITVEIADEHQPENLLTLEDSKEPSETKSPESEHHSSPSPHSSDDEANTTPS